MSGVNDFIHRYVAGTEGARTLLLLHGTGGDEGALLGMGAEVAPGVGLLSPRGKVLEHGSPRFFRRFAEGVLDIDDLIARSHELAAFISDAAAQYGFAAETVDALGFSNGANAVTGLLLLHPDVIQRAVLMRPMHIPELTATPDLTGKGVLILAGRTDELTTPQATEALAAQYEGLGAAVTLHWEQTGHRLTPGDVAAAKAWLAVRE